MIGTEGSDGKLEWCGRERADLKTWYLRTVKLAAAVAVIKSKPPGRSGRQQAEYLAAKLKSQDVDWKAKAQSLQEEVLHLRQELFLNKILSKPSSSDTTGVGSIDPESGNSTSAWEKDSGCETQENSQVPPPSPNPGEPAFADPARQSLLSPALIGGTQDRTVLLHTQFLQSLVGLARLEGRDLPDGDCAIVPDSVTQLLAGMVSVCRDVQPPPSAPLLLRAARVVARAADCGISGRPPSTDAMTRLEGSLKELTDLLLTNSQLNRFPMQETLTDCLTLLGGSTVLKPLLIRHVLHLINCFANQLWELCQGEDGGGLRRFDAGKYENSFYLLRVLEQLVGGERAEQLAVGGGEGAELGRQLGRLERRALQLSEEFPLFAIYAWRTTAHPSPAHAAQTTNATRVQRQEDRPPVCS